MKKKLSSPLSQPRLYEILAERILKEHVETASPGDRLPTETEFSKLYEVSVPTVREALRSLVQSGLLRRRQGSGTYRNEKASAPGNPSESNKHVAIVTPMDLAVGGISCHYPQIIFHTYKTLLSAGVHSHIYYGETPLHSPREFDDSLLIREIQEGRVSAVFSVGESLDQEVGYLKAAESVGVPCISASTAKSSQGIVQKEDFLLKAVDSLLNHSRRKIACIGFGAESKLSNDLTFEKIVTGRGAITDRSWMVGDLHPVSAGSGYSLMREIWTTSRIKPDGLVLCDDVYFNDVALAIHELGIKSPEQLMIVSLRNEGERIYAPFQFIEFKYTATNLASQFANNILGLLSGKPPRDVIFDPLLIDPFLEEESPVETVA